MNGIKYKISAIVLVLGILSLTTGISYSIFSTKQEDEKTEIIKAGAVTLKLTEEESLSLDNMYALTDEEGLEQNEYYSFNITNTGDSDANIIIYLTDDQDKLEGYEGSLLDKQYVRTSIEINNEKMAAKNTFTKYNGVVAEDTLKIGESKEYKLRLWLDFTGISNENIIKMKDNKAFFKVKVIAEQKVAE